MANCKRQRYRKRRNDTETSRNGTLFFLICHDVDNNKADPSIGEVPPVDISLTGL